MIEKRLSISDAAKQLSVETHVLRYWELELGLNISRNAQGHRFYEPKDITTLMQIKYLKEQGFRLQAIKLLLSDLEEVYTMDKKNLWELRDRLNAEVSQEDTTEYTNRRMGQIMPLHPKKNHLANVPFHQVESDYNYEMAEEKLKHFEAMMRKMIKNTIEEMTEASEERICSQISTKILKELDYLERQKDELQEKQISLLQDILNEVKRGGLEAAATEEAAIAQTNAPKKEKKKGLFSKRSKK